MSFDAGSFVGVVFVSSSYLVLSVFDFEVFAPFFDEGFAEDGRLVTRLSFVVFIAVLSLSDSLALGSS